MNRSRYKEDRKVNIEKRAKTIFFRCVAELSTLSTRNNSDI